MREVSVIMAVYNGMPYLPEAVDSILSQTFKDFIFIIINDGSTDGTEEYLNLLDEPRIHVVHQSNRGQGVARNVGLGMCDSEFVAIMDADDVAIATRLESQLNFLRCHKDVGMLGTHFAYLGNDDLSGFSPPMACDHETIYSDLLCGRLALSNATLMCRTPILKEISGYRISSKGEDWDMFLRMGEVTRLANLKEVLHLYRLHSGSENGRILPQVRLRQAHACECAKRRAESQPEPLYDEFLARHLARPSWKKLVEVMDYYASDQYRLALTDILNSHQGRGYARLAWAALCSPQRTGQRISRAIRKRKKS